MRTKYTLFLLLLISLLISVCGVVGAEEEINGEQELIKSAETAKESIREAITEMKNTFDATKRALKATHNALLDIWNTANYALASAQSTLEAVQASIDEWNIDNGNTTENERNESLDRNWLTVDNGYLT